MLTVQRLEQCKGWIDRETDGRRLTTQRPINQLQRPIPAKSGLTFGYEMPG